MVKFLSKGKDLVTSVLVCDAVFLCFRMWLLDFGINVVSLFYLQDIHVDNLRKDMDSYSK